MNERVAKLRQNSLSAVPTLSPERALLVTEAYRNMGLEPVPIQRALAFKHIMENKTIWIGAGELIVGERGPAPKCTPTCPELCCHSLEDLNILNGRPKTPFVVDEHTQAKYRDEIIPFWQGRTIRERVFAEMTTEWQTAYHHGIFTEFMEQRAPGHTVLDDKIYHKGFLEFVGDIKTALSGLDYFNDTEAYGKKNELEAMKICAEALMALAARHAAEARRLASQEPDPLRREELSEIAAVCGRVPAHRPETFREALQYYWFVHLGVITELNPWDAFNPGRLDQHLYPFYQKGLQDGSLTEESARELLQCFWVKFNNQPAPPKVGVTAEESGTYTDFANINLGGLKPDGSDGVNELTYLILEVIDEMRLLQPSSNIQLSRKSPDRFLKHACRIIRQGWGQPSIFNADIVVEEMLRQGKSIVDARCGGNSGCVETGAFGKEAFILTGYFNLPKVLEITLNNGTDPRTGELIGLATGRPTDFRSFGDLLTAFRRQLDYFIDIKIRGNNLIEQIFAQFMPVPFLSLLIDDCLANGRDYHAGGARYNSNYIQGVGIGTLTDSFSAIRQHVFESGTLTMERLLEVLAADFIGYEKERQIFMNKTPRYGNDDDAADGLMKQLFDIYYEAVNGRPTMRGGTYRINMLPTTCHVYFGSVTGATPDGRPAGAPLSEGISPGKGADRVGPTGVLKSASKMDHVRTGGTLLNQKFTPALLEGDDGLSNLANLVRTYFKLDGHHIQFNVVKAETLREAQVHPDQYRDLIVRVAGYSDYFCDLNKVLQDEIIARTEHRHF
jgi:formate C-acetyltransferase